MLRAEPLRLASGAITETVPWRSSACLAANRPREVMPSSLVSRMCTRVSLWRAGGDLDASSVHVRARHKKITCPVPERCLAHTSGN